MAKNLPANAGDTGLIPGLGSTCCGATRAQTLQLLSQGPGAREPQPLSPRAVTTEALALEPGLQTKRSYCSVKPVHRDWRKPTQSHKGSAQPKPPAASKFPGVGPRHWNF